MPSGAKSTGAARVNSGQPIDTAGLAETLRSALQLRYPPVALAFVSSPPRGLEVVSDAVPSACTFWRMCEQRVFFAPADAHYECPIGALTMGFSMPDTVRDRLMDLVGRIGQVGYLGPEEAENIPSVPGDKCGIVYGPLGSIPLEPDVALAWVSPAATMLLAEAIGASRWTPEQAGIATFGRPSCAAVPVAIARGTPTFSAGCAGMRTFTEVERGLQLAVLPRPALDGLRERLEVTARLNERMNEYYDAQKARFAPAAARA
jgi:uncharacterized protein (DUF169 family)